MKTDQLMYAVEKNFSFACYIFERNSHKYKSQRKAMPGRAPFPESVSMIFTTSTSETSCFVSISVGTAGCTVSGCRSVTVTLFNISGQTNVSMEDDGLDCTYVGHLFHGRVHRWISMMMAISVNTNA